MRKIPFYSKLALSNLLRNRSTYLPYLLACTVSIATFYTLLAINFNPALAEMRGASVVASFTAVGTVILGIFCIVLLFYTNSFLIKRRKKEIGLYSILGMEKKNIGILMLFETMFIAVIALVVGLASGAVVARLLFLLLLKLVRTPVVLDMPVSFLSIKITATFFLFIFLLTLLSNLRQVRVANPIELMAGAKQGEKEPKASWILTVFGLITTGAGYYIAITTKDPVTAIMLFLVAAFLVIIGTFCLFTSGSIALLKLLRRNKNYYYTPKHFVPVSGMIYRMKQNAAGLASICVLSCMVLVTVSATASLYIGAEDALRAQYPVEYQISSRGEAVDDPTLTEGALAAAEKAAGETGVSLTNVLAFRSAQIFSEKNGDAYKPMGGFSNNGAYALFTLIPLEDYNRLAASPASLAQGQALLMPEDKHHAYASDTLNLNGSSYNVTISDTSFLYSGNNMGAYAKSYVLILPTVADIETILDAQANPGSENGNPALDLSYTLHFDTDGTEAQKENFYTVFFETVTAGPEIEFLKIDSRLSHAQGWYATNGGFMFLGLYFGILFIMATAMIIYYKQISEGYDDHDRFVTLQKVGMSGPEVRKTINSQIRTVFLLPLLVAIVHISVAFLPVSKGLMLFGLTNTPLFLIATAATILLYALLYYLIYMRTAKTYYRIVRVEN